MTVEDQKLQRANRGIRAVTWLGVVVNIALAILKITVGLAGGSMALVADGVHSLSDLATDFAVLVGVHFGSKEPDLEHPYGHGRFETFATVAVAAVLVAVGVVTIQKGAVAMAIVDVNGGVRKVGYGMMAAAVISVVAKEALYWITRAVAVRSHSSVLYANAWHHRSDAFSSVAVVIGFIMMKFGYVHGDHVAAIVVGLLIILVGVRIIGGCFHEFTECSVDTATIEQIKRAIVSESRVRNWHKLRTRSVGREIFLDLHILVDPELNITEAHEISDSLERTMHDQMLRPVNITVHIEPDTPELRK